MLWRCFPCRQLLQLLPSHPLLMDKTPHLSRLCRCPLSRRCSLAALLCPLLVTPPL